MTDPELAWTPLAGLPPEVVGGLVVEYGERARSATRDERWRRESGTIRAVGDALAAAATGALPTEPTSAMPSWLGAVVAAQLRAPRAVLVRSAQTVRALERLGLVQLDHDTDYALAMLHLSGEWVRRGDEAEDLLVQVAHDPTLMERIVHRLSTDERERGVTPDDVRPFRGSWQRPLAAVVEPDPRARQLTAAASLDGLSGEPGSDRTAWYVGMLDALTLTADDLADHQPALRRLLTSTSPTVVRYGLRRLRQLDRARLLDDDATAVALRPAVTVRTKTTARLAVRLLADIAVRSPTAEVTATALAALSHADGEVQQRAALLLVSRGPDTISAAELAALEPSVQHELNALTGPPRPPQDRQRVRNRTRTSGDLEHVPADVLGGLVVEHGERARATTYDDRWEKENALFWAVGDAVRAALKDQRPSVPTTRMPSWLGPMLRRRLADIDSISSAEQFFYIRVVERAGLVELEADDQYVTATIVSLVNPWSSESRKGGTPERWFAGDPELLDRAFWRIFEVPGNGTISLFQTDQYASGAWQRAVLAMIDDGRIDRPRVLDDALTTLSREWPGYRLQWFAQLLTALEISVPELAARQPALRRLLRSTESAALTPAMGWLTRLSESGQLDDHSTAAELGPLMTARTKTLALSGLTLLTAIHRRDPAVDVAPCARQALAHPHADVQRRAAALLTRVGADQQIAASADELDPVVRRELGLDARSPEPAAPPPVADDLPPLRAVTPIDLLERLAAVMEAPGDPLELELVLDGLARTNDPTVLSPLVKRATAILRRGPGDWEGDSWLAGHLARLVTVACGRPVPVGRPHGPVLAFLVDRLAEVEEILEGRTRPGPLLATPDSPAGWVSANALVQRLREDSAEHRPADRVAAFLRLHPEGRREALVDADLSGELGRALQHALGGRESTAADVQDADLWVAASRARNPLGEDPLLIGAGYGAAGQGRGLDFSVTAHRHRNVHRVLGLVAWEDLSWELDLTLAHAARRSRGGEGGQPTVLASRRRREFDYLDGDWHAWAATVWPHDAEHFSEHALRLMLAAVEGSGSSGRAEHILRALDRHPGRLGRLATSMLALGLAAVRLEDRVLAADAFLHLAGARMPAADLAHAMAGMAGPSPATRWAESLRNAASGGGGATVVAVLTQLMPQLESSHHGLYALLDLLHQEQLRLGGPVEDPTLRGWLATLKGSSKSARSARALLAL